MSVQKSVRQQHGRIRCIIDQVPALFLNKSIRNQILCRQAFKRNPHVPFTPSFFLTKNCFRSRMKVTFIPHCYVAIVTTEISVGCCAERLACLFPNAGNRHALTTGSGRAPVRLRRDLNPFQAYSARLHPEFLRNGRVSSYNKK